MNSGTSVVNLAELKLYDLELLERERVLCIVDASNYIKDLYGCKCITRGRTYSSAMIALARSGISGQMGVFARNTHTQWAPESWGEHPHLSKIVSDLPYNHLSIFLVFSHKGSY